MALLEVPRFEILLEKEMLGDEMGGGGVCFLHFRGERREEERRGARSKT